ncbi:membrane protein YfhO [Ancylomarina subtilis]|uniref:Membrane protein YfhO n=1 Tax=Ancylomarina subtilis TaxID=1639035 RepID=A0A4Q7VM37_9BACT|nr:YfhO family protein [Ancylomarina subtilis]RZT97361.1 membrane protein YfhO [Ancylomarina subtilis]
MDFKNLFQKLIPYLSAVFIFLIIGFIYFQPVLEGKELRKGDSLNAWGGKKEIIDYRKATGEDPLWTNSMFGGMPAYQINVDYQAKDMYFFKQLIELHTPDPVRYLLLYLIGFYILMLSLRVNPWLSIAGAVAYAFSTYFIIIIGAGHLWKVNALAFIPPALAGILMVFRGRYLWGGLLATFFLIMELYSNHIQMTYYFAIMVFCLVIFEFYYRLKAKELKQFFRALAVLLAASFIAIAVNNTNLYNSYQYSKSTIRGKSELTIGDKNNKTAGLDKDYATQWSYGIQETLSLLIPNVKGGAGSPQEAVQIVNYVSGGQIKKVDDYYGMEQVDNHHYWGNQPFTAGPVYVGALIMFLFVLGLFIVPGRLKWGLLTATILSIMLSWGHHFAGLTNFFLDYVPLYNKFRVVSSILIVVEICVPLLAILAVKKLIDEPDVLKRKIAFGSLNLNITILPLVLTGGLALLLFLLPNLGLDFMSDIETSYFAQIKSGNPDAIGFISQIQSDLINARISIFRADALRSVVFVALGAVLLFFYSRKTISAKVMVSALIVLILADLWPVNKRYLNNDSFVAKKDLKLAFNPTQADYEILQMEIQNHPDLGAKLQKAATDYKKENRKANQYEMVAAQLWALNMNSDYRVYNKTGGAFQNSSTSYYHKSIGGYHGAKLRRIQELYDYHIEKNNAKVLNMLNARYEIVRSEQGGTHAVYNPDALGAAWLVSNVKMVDNANEEIMSLNAFDPAKELIVDKRFADQVKGFVGSVDSLASIKMTHYAPNAIQYDYQSKVEQLAVFSEMYYQPGWNAYIDGKLSPHFRANYVLRAMRLPAGKHKIEFKFEPKAFYVGENISLASMILFFTLVLGGLAWTLRSYRKNTSDE